MGRISTGIGLISGINSKDIIDQLMALEARPKTLVSTRLAQVNQQKLAYTDLVTRLTGLKLSATTLKKTATFQQTAAKSSNEDALTATAAAGAAQGSFQFQVARLVTAQQSVTGGFADTSAKVGAGTVTVELGGGEVHSQTLLSQLNGGQGVHLGAFRITDRSGNSSVIDISGAFTLDDVLRKINTNVDISVKAQITGDKLALTDSSGQTASNLIVADLGSATSAAELGIAASAAANTLLGSTINYLGRATALSQINDARGVRTAASGADFRINARDGSTFDITVGSFTNVGQVIDAINSATGGKVVASIPANGRGIRLVDTTAGGTFSVAALNGSKAPTDLGIEQTAAAAQIDGAPILASINTVLLSSLRGGVGLDLGAISVTDRAGASASIDLAGANTLQEILDLINNASGIEVSATLKEAGNGIQITDRSAGSGNLVIADLTSTTAAELGIAGTFTPDTPTVRGANLQRRWVNETSLLSAYNAGKGVSAGKFKITNSNGAYATVDLTTGTYRTLNDIIQAINAKGISVTASVNTNGDGLLLTDSAGGPAKLTVEDLTGRAAADLNIAGTAAATTIDGSFEKTITLTADDTLQTAMDALNAPGFALSATLVNDGSGQSPFRLSMTARNTGSNGCFVFDAGNTALQASTLVEAQNAAVIYGGSAAEQPIVITSGTNQLTGVVKGLTIDLHAVTSSPVTITVTQNIDNVVSELQRFTDSFNGISDKLRDLTKFDTKTNARGILLGDSTTQQVQQRIYTFFYETVAGAGIYKSLNDVGLRVGKDAKIEFDETKFRAAYTADPESVKKLFTLYEKGATTAQDKKGLGYLIEDKISSLTDPASGLITRQSQALDLRTDQYQDRVTQLDKLIAAKRGRLERQFSNLEIVLANLQAQQTSLTNYTSFLQASTTSSK